MKEKWKDIFGYEGMYKISNYGRVKSYPRNGTQARQAHILKPSTSKSGYKRVTLFKNNNPKYIAIHRLVAESFLDNPCNKNEINHIDGDKSNNMVENLEWVTRSENHIHRVYKLECNPLKKCKKILCVETGEVFPSVRAAARILGADHRGISRALNGEYKQSCGYHWHFI